MATGRTVRQVKHVERVRRSQTSLNPVSSPEVVRFKETSCDVAKVVKTSAFGEQDPQQRIKNFQVMYGSECRGKIIMVFKISVLCSMFQKSAGFSIFWVFTYLEISTVPKYILNILLNSYNSFLNFLLSTVQIKNKNGVG